jgi:hypothetical protein
MALRCEIHRVFEVTAITPPPFLVHAQLVAIPMRKRGSHNGVSEAPLWLLQSKCPKGIMKKYRDEDWAKLNLKSHESVSSRFYLPLRNV